jgi:hypothetical protein
MAGRILAGGPLNRRGTGCDPAGVRPEDRASGVGDGVMLADMVPGTTTYYDEPPPDKAKGE